MSGVGWVAGLNDNITNSAKLGFGIGLSLSKLKNTSTATAQALYTEDQPYMLHLLLYLLCWLVWVNSTSVYKMRVCACMCESPLHSRPDRARI